MGISARKTVFRNIENPVRNWRKTLEKQALCFFVNISKHFKYFLKRFFVIFWYFNEKLNVIENLVKLFFFRIHI